MIDWLYGPRFPAYAQYWTMMLRNLTMDIETLVDASREIPRIVERSGAMSFQIGTTIQRELQYRAKTIYRIRERVVAEDELSDLGVFDRNQLVMDVEISATEPVEWNPEGSPATATLTVSIDSPNAQIRLDGFVSPDENRIFHEIGDYLYANATLRPDWRSAQWVAWLAPIPVALGAWAWLAFTGGWPPALHLLIFAVIALAASGSISRAIAERKKSREKTVGRSFQYRGESRQATRQRRADSHSNIKVFLITAPVSLFIGLIVGWLT